MKLKTRYWLLHLPISCERGSFCSPYTKTTQKPCYMCFIEPLSTWMQKTHYWPERKNPRRGIDRKMHGRIEDGRRLELETNRRISTPNRPLEGLWNFTLLTAPIDQVLMQIKDDTTLTWSGKLKGDPNKRSRDKYCRFHCDHGHDTFECYDLKQ